MANASPSRKRPQPKAPCRADAGTKAFGVHPLGCHSSAPTTETKGHPVRPRSLVPPTPARAPGAWLFYPQAAPLGFGRFFSVPPGRAALPRSPDLFAWKSPEIVQTPGGDLSSGERHTDFIHKVREKCWMNTSSFAASWASPGRPPRPAGKPGQTRPGNHLTMTNNKFSMANSEFKPADS